MYARNVAQLKATTSSLSPVRSGLLQRKCACGNHTVAGGECDACRRKREGIAHQAVNQPRPAPSALDRQAVRVPSAPVNEFEDCPADWQTKANAALVVARRWVANVVTGLANLSYPFPPAVARLLNRHFRITDRGYVYEVRRHFNTIYSALNGPIEFECETECDDSVAAYVYTIWSDVHLCPIWYRLSRAEQANTIIHEIAHDAANRDDEAYIWQAKYSKLSVEDAVDNADSYSNFAEEAIGP